LRKLSAKRAVSPSDATVGLALVFHPRRPP